MASTENTQRMARFGGFGFAVIALACASFAAFLVSRMIQARGLQQERKLPVVVTTRAISAGETLRREWLRTTVFPESNVPAGAVSQIEPLFKGGKAPIAATGITLGEPLIAARLADGARGTAIAARVQPGYRAVAVKVDNAIARAGLVYPGARVDVIGTVRNTKTFISATRIALENVRVLSVESRTDVETNQARPESSGEGAQSTERSDAVVTIEVTPEQAELVILAEREGKVDLALRNGTDTTAVATPGVTPVRFSAAAGQGDGAATADANGLLHKAARRHIETRGASKKSGEGGEPKTIETYHVR